MTSRPAVPGCVTSAGLAPAGYANIVEVATVAAARVAVQDVVGLEEGGGAQRPGVTRHREGDVVPCIWMDSKQRIKKRLGRH
jgi:hypothetical protein